VPSNSRGDAVWSIPDLQTNHKQNYKQSGNNNFSNNNYIVIFSNDNLANNYYIPGLLLLQDQASLLIFSNNNFQLAYAAGFLMISLPLMNVNETRRRKNHEKNSKKDTETWGEFMSHYWDG